MTDSFSTLDLRKLVAAYGSVERRLNFNRWGGWPAAAWSRDSHALVVSVSGCGMVLDYSGAHVDYEVTEGGRDMDDCGIAPPADGLWIWKGKYVCTAFSSGDYGCEYEYESEPDGELRRLTVEEAVALRNGKSILPEEPLSPGLVERLWNAVEKDREGELLACMRVLRSNDLNRDDVFVFVVEAMQWREPEEADRRFAELMRKVGWE